jgi:hypothetical protein
MNKLTDNQTSTLWPKRVNRVYITNIYNTLCNKVKVYHQFWTSSQTYLLNDKMSLEHNGAITNDHHTKEHICFQYLLDYPNHLRNCTWTSSCYSEDTAYFKLMQIIIKFNVCIYTITLHVMVYLLTAVLFKQWLLHLKTRQLWIYFMFWELKIQQNLHMAYKYCSNLSMKWTIIV